LIKRTYISKNGNLLALVVLLMLLPFVGKAQQDPVFTQYLNNVLTVQPAYAGSQGTLNVTALSRQQWVGFDGAPSTNTLTVQAPLNSYNVGLGVSIMNDSWGPVKQNGIYFDYAYRVRANRYRSRQYISFGLEAGFNLYEARLTGLQINDPNDPVFAQDINYKFLPNFGVGVMWHGDRFFLGISVPKILRNNIQKETTDLSQKEVLHFYLMGAQVFNVSRYGTLKFKPSFLVRYAENSPISADVSAQFLLSDKVWVGATYRYQNSFGGLLQFYINPQLKIGYAYDMTTMSEAHYNAGTHEFMVSYDFDLGRRRRRMGPRYF